MTQATCSVGGCKRRVVARGLCAGHYAKERANGTLDQFPLVRGPKGPCSIDGCDEISQHVGLCGNHYYRRRRYGSPLGQPDPEVARLRNQRISGANTGRKFTDEHRANISKALTGRHLSPEHAAKTRAAHLGSKHNMGPLTEKQRLHLIKARAAKGPTRLELALRALLDELGVEFDEQVPIGNHTVDAYVPKLGMVVEADGWYWHRSEAKERSRDSYLMRNPLVASIVHLTDKQLAPWTPTERWSKEYRPHRFSQAA